MVGDVNGAYFAAGMVSKEGLLQGGGKGMRAVGVSEDFMELHWSAEVDSGFIFRKLWVVEIEERM